MSDDTLNTLTFTIVEEKEMPEPLDLGIRELLVECFPHHAGHYSRTRAWHSRPSWAVTARTPDGTIAAHCAVVERTVAVADGRRVTVSGIQGFSVRPVWRKTGLSDRMMAIALTAARRRGMEAGLLFCAPCLERVYGRMGWRPVHFPVTMRDGEGNSAPIQENNIAMVIPLTIEEFPPGDIDLLGPDW